MNSIYDCIQNIPTSRVALINATRTYTFEDILTIRQKNMTTLQGLQNTAVVINGRNRSEFALLLSLLDGVASKILFLPSDIDKALHKQYYKQVKIVFELYLENDVLKYTTVLQNKVEKNTISTTIATEWIIPTSGTTNIPKLVSHTFSSLTKSTKFNVELGGHYRWGLVFDIYRFSGIQVFLQSILSGSTLIVVDPAQSMSEMLTLLINKGCNALSATPSFWRKVLMTKESNDLKLERITLGGEIADQNVLQALKQKFKTAKITHIYASTEVGVGFSVTDGKEGFPTSYLDGKLSGIKMKVSSDGLLWIAPSEQGQKYLSPDRMYDEEGYINTGDLVEIKGDRVYFLGRDSGAINVGGNKVQPEEVEQILLSSGFLSSAYVYAKKNPMMGLLVCADVIPLNDNSDKKELKAKLLKHCREKLEGFKVPAILKFVKELKTTQSGKLERKLK